MSIRGNPRGYSLSQAQHIVARSPKNELLEWYWTKEEGWQLVNLTTAVAGGQRIEGTPYGFGRLDQAILARSSHNHLLSWRWSRSDGWRVISLSSAVGGRLIAGSPHLYVARGIGDELLMWASDGRNYTVTDLSATAENGQLIGGDPYRFDFYGIPTIVTRSRTNELLEWERAIFYEGGRRNLGAWRVWNRSDDEGGAPISSDPSGYGITEHTTANTSKHVVARSHNDELLAWSWPSEDNAWEVVNLSAAVPGGQSIGGNPQNYATTERPDPQHTQHVIARSRNNELLEWYWKRRDGWQMVNLSTAVAGGQQIKSDPFGYVLYDTEEDWDTQHIVARGYRDELLEWYWNPRDGWQIYNFGEPAGQWLEPVLNIVLP